jgi:hypothetical protein
VWSPEERVPRALLASPALFVAFWEQAKLPEKFQLIPVEVVLSDQAVVDYDDVTTWRWLPCVGHAGGDPGYPSLERVSCGMGTACSSGAP